MTPNSLFALFDPRQRSAAMPPGGQDPLLSMLVHPQQIAALATQGKGQQQPQRAAAPIPHAPAATAPSASAGSLAAAFTPPMPPMRMQAPAAPSIAPAGPVKVDGFNTHAAVAQELVKRGVRPEVAAGAVASLMGEGGHMLDPASFNPSDAGEGNHSIGFGQWNRDRAAGLQTLAAKMGVPWTDPRAQVAFLGQELDGSHRHVLAALRGATTPEQGTHIWTAQYEVPRVDNSDYRYRTNLATAQSYINAGQQPTPVVPAQNGAPALPTPAGTMAAVAGVTPIASTPAPSSNFDFSKFATGGAAARGDSFSNIDPRLGQGLTKLFTSAPPEIQQNLRITSAYRSPEVQGKLWQDALAKYGSPDVARQWVAPPGHSKHGEGVAADLKYLSPVAQQWAHDHAGEAGLTFPLKNEPWHVEPVGVRDKVAAAGTAMPPVPGPGAPPDAASWLPNGAGAPPALPNSQIATQMMAQQQQALAAQQQADAAQQQQLAKAEQDRKRALFSDLGSFFG